MAATNRERANDHEGVRIRLGALDLGIGQLVGGVIILLAVGLIVGQMLTRERLPIGGAPVPTATMPDTAAETLRAPAVAGEEPVAQPAVEAPAPAAPAQAGETINCTTDPSSFVEGASSCVGQPAAPEEAPAAASARQEQGNALAAPLTAPTVVSDLVELAPTEPSGWSVPYVSGYDPTAAAQPKILAPTPEGRP